MHALTVHAAALSSQTAWIDREVAKQQAQVDKITKHHAECKQQRDVMIKALADSVETMQDSVRYCSTMKQKTNSNIARLTRTMAPKEKDNFLKTGISEKDHELIRFVQLPIAHPWPHFCCAFREVHQVDCILHATNVLVISLKFIDLLTSHLIFCLCASIATRLDDQCWATAIPSGTAPFSPRLLRATP